jgi:hypothetical protein
VNVFVWDNFDDEAGEEVNVCTAPAYGIENSVSGTTGCNYNVFHYT